MAIKIGDVVGNYRVIGLAGSGGMGAVYKIENLISQRVEAMKLLPVGISSDPGQVQRFEREIQVHARLHHPNIAALYNAVRDGSSVALIMEYVEGEPLERILEGGRLPLRTAINYAGQVLDALAYAHREGVIHRDVAPANIIITPENTAKLTDFGLARTTADLRLTNSGVAVGSPWYMSPEQVRALDELDARTDIYAMGAVLHEMLTGRKLFDVDGSFAVMCAQTETVPQPPSASNSEVPAALDAVVAKALAKDPAARFQSAEEFRRAMDSAVGIAAAAAARSTTSRPGRMPWPKAVLVALVPAAVMAVVYAFLLWPKPARVAAKANAPAAAVASKPEPVAVVVAEPRAPEAAVVVPRPESRPAPPAAHSTRRASAPQPSRTVWITGGTVEPPSATAPPPAAPRIIVSASAPEVPAVKPNVATVPAAPPQPVAQTPAEPEGAPTPEEAKPQKTGNRFVRALGKLNPFKAPAKKDQ